MKYHFPLIRLCITLAICASFASCGGSHHEDTSVKDGTTVVYVTIVSHNETDSRYDGYDSPALYRQFRDNLIRIASIVNAHGAAWNFQSDYRFLLAAATHEASTDITASTGGKNILRYLSEDMGVEIDPHTHEQDKYNYADIACLIDDLGVTPSATVGGFIYDDQSIQDWERFRQPLAGQVCEGYEWHASTLWGAGSFQHAGDDDNSSGVWRPSSYEDFYTDSPGENLAYIGHGGGFAGLKALLADLASGAAPEGKIYTGDYFIPEAEFLDAGEDSFTELESVLTSLEGYAAQGKIQWKHLSEIRELWECRYHSEPNCYFPAH